MKILDHIIDPRERPKFSRHYEVRKRFNIDGIELFTAEVRPLSKINNKG